LPEAKTAPPMYVACEKKNIWVVRVYSSQQA
jgi:hypothetical protein